MAPFFLRYTTVIHIFKTHVCGTRMLYALYIPTLFRNERVTLLNLFPDPINCVFVLSYSGMASAPLFAQLAWVNSLFHPRVHPPDAPVGTTDASSKLPLNRLAAAATCRIILLD